jgi:hypothetical protein
VGLSERAAVMDGGRRGGGDKKESSQRIRSELSTCWEFYAQRSVDPGPKPKRKERCSTGTSEQKAPKQNKKQNAKQGRGGEGGGGQRRQSGRGRL